MHVDEHTRYWAARLLELTQEMARQGTNAAHQVLSAADSVTSGRNYPEDAMLFASGQWRAFYHCHDDELIHPDEHGHFHLFTDLGDQNWAHLAGLSVDAQGQPLQWFMVNRWVTDGPWLSEEYFAEKLKAVTADEEQEAYAENWLSVMLQLYRDTLSELLNERDRTLVSDSSCNTITEALEDRDVYTLSKTAIDLQRTLEMNLLQDGNAIAEKVA